MAKRGRPTKLTVRKQEEFCDLIDSGVSSSAAARLLGWSPSTITKALARDERFRKRVRRTESAAELMRLKKLYILAPSRKRAAVKQLVDSYRGIIQPGLKNRKLSHKLSSAIFRLAATQLRPYLEER